MEDLKNYMTDKSHEPVDTEMQKLAKMGENYVLEHKLQANDF